MTEITVFNTKFKIPTRWEDLNREQYLFLMELRSNSNDMSYIKIAAIIKFMGISWQQFVSISVSGISEVINDNLKWIEEIPTFQKNPLGSISLGLHTYEAPAAGLIDMTFQQFFEYSEQYLSAFQKTKDEQYLSAMCTSVYIATYRGRKQSFADYDVQKHQRTFEKAKPHVRHAIFHVYINERDKLIQKFPKLFSSKTDKEQKFSFVNMIEMFNGKDISNNEAVKNTYLHEACTRLGNMIEESKQKQNVRPK